jgi:hypothetical protein
MKSTLSLAARALSFASALALLPVLALAQSTGTLT